MVNHFIYDLLCLVKLNFMIEIQKEKLELVKKLRIILPLGVSIHENDMVDTLDKLREFNKIHQPIPFEERLKYEKFLNALDDEDYETCCKYILI